MVKGRILYIQNPPCSPFHLGFIMKSLQSCVNGRIRVDNSADSVIGSSISRALTHLVLLFGDVVQWERQQEVLGPDEEPPPLFIQEQSAEAARTLQLEPPHAVELLQLWEDAQGWKQRDSKYTKKLTFYTKYTQIHERKLIVCIGLTLTGWCRSIAPLLPGRHECWRPIV